MKNRRDSLEKDARAIIESRLKDLDGIPVQESKTLEGGCGVIGIIGSDRLPGRLIIRSCRQMQNRGNGKGGGVAAVGLFPKKLKNHYAIHVAYLDEKVREGLEKKYIHSGFDVDKVERLKNVDDHTKVGLEVKPPTVYRYFAKVKTDVAKRFMKRRRIISVQAAKDEFVFQNSYALNNELYVAPDKPRAFVLSHGKDLMILKAVGFAEQVASYYELENTLANIWIGHQRFPTRGRVWHPGGAHPFVGLNEALVHNGDFANYYAVTEYLRQRGVVPQFVTDTEVSVLLFDLYSRVLGYPLEYVIEALAPTPEGDFERLSKRRQRIYRAIQTAHLHGSPDGPWFFIVARNDPQTGNPQLVGITDVSMLRPQVFAFQSGEKSYGAIGSEKQAIDAFFEDLSEIEPAASPVADLYWNARGGSCTDGGAFSFSLVENENGKTIEVKDKFQNPIVVQNEKSSKDGDYRKRTSFTRNFEIGPDRMKDAAVAASRKLSAISTNLKPMENQEYLDEDDEPTRRENRLRWGELAGSKKQQESTKDFKSILLNGRFEEFAKAVEKTIGKKSSTAEWKDALSAITFLRDRRWDPVTVKRSQILANLDKAVNSILDSISGPDKPQTRFAMRLDKKTAWSSVLPPPQNPECSLVLDANGFEPEGNSSVARVIVAAHKNGWRKFIIYKCSGDRFIGCGLGPKTEDVRIDVYGSSGDYLGSGIDGACIYVHGNAQDQVGQILKAGKIVIFGDVGQTFLYGAKGGETFVMGSAAGRPLINAVGGIRAIINGTCLDYCAESFMAGKQLDGGFVIINGLTFDLHGDVIGLEIKYPGNNLFSLASGGACYLNDPYSTVSQSQLNGASFVPFKQDDWNVILYYLKRNEALFGISIRHDLLMVDGLQSWPKEVFRKVVASLETEKLDWSSIPG